MNLTILTNQKTYKIAIDKKRSMASIVCSKGDCKLINNDIISLKRIIYEIIKCSYDLYYYSRFNLSYDDETNFLYLYKTILQQDLPEPMFEFLVSSEYKFIDKFIATRSIKIEGPYIGFLDFPETYEPTISVLYGYNNNFSLFSDEFNMQVF